MVNILQSILIGLSLFQSIKASETCANEISTKEALQVLQKAMHEEQSIREFFHNHVVKEGDHNFCGKPSSCADLMYAGFKKSGPYTIHFKPWFKAKPVTVFCDMETEGGGWTVFQRRNEYPERQINFTREWSDYANGFGNVNEEFWLGNKYLHLLTAQDRVELRIDLENFENDHRYAKYDAFEVADKDQDYKVNVTQFHGNCGDSFSGTNGLKFVTIDRNDVNNCAKNYRGGWWYGACHASNLNGEYLSGKHESYANGVNWSHWLGAHYSLKMTEMKVRPKSFKH